MCLKKTIVHEIAVVNSGVNKGCDSGASHVKVKNATKITYVVETCTKVRIDVIREGGNKNEIEVTSRGNRMSRVTIAETKCRIVGFI